MKTRLVKFEEDGNVCKNDINYLRRHPECGIPFIQDKPFKPDNPKHKFRPHDRNFNIDILDRAIPSDPNIPPAPPIGQSTLQATAIDGTPYTNQYLPQDYTNKYDLAGRRILDDTPHGNSVDEYVANKIVNYFNKSGYGALPRIGNDSYSHETPERLTRPVGDIDMEDFGAGVGIPNDRPPTTLRSTRIRPLKPRGMTDEELIDAQIEQLTRNLPQKEAKQVERSIRKGKSKAKVKPTEQEMFPIEPESEELQILKEIDKILKPNETELTIRQKDNLVKEMATRGVSRERVEEVLNMYEAYDPALERAIGGTSRGTDEERLLRRLRSSIREMPTRDTNLIPERLQEIELREDTPLTRGRTDIAPGRSRVEKVMDKTAGKLPEELRSVYKSAQRNTESFNENVRTRSLEAIQQVRATTTRVFGQRYTGIRQEALELRGGDIELVAPEGNINVRPPATEDFTGLRPGDLQALNFDPLGADYQETFVRGTKPTLTYSERLQRVRTGALSREAGIGGAGAAGGVLIGFLTAELMGKAGVDNKYAIAAGAGGAGGAGARILTMAGSRALTRGAATTVAETATYTAIRGGTSLLRGAAEGAVVGIVLMPVDMALNTAFVNHGMSHAGANVASGALVGGGATALTTIGLASLGAAGETLGASLVVGAIAMGVTSLIGFFTGKSQDRKEKKAKEQEEIAERAITHLNTTSTARQRFLETLPNYGYDFNKALAAFTDKDNLGIDDDTWSSFSSNVGNMFKPRPSNSPPPTHTSGEPPTGEEKRINDLFSQYITHELIGRVCTGDTGCEELKRQDNGELTEDEVNFLNDKTGSTWRNSANMQVEMSVQELNYTRQRMGNAQLEMLNAWNKEQKVANQLDPYVVQTASLDPTFRQRYDLAVKLDAEQRVVDAYQNNQTKIEQLPKNVRDMANTDPEFDNMIHTYYNSMETTAGQLDITIPQLIHLQGLSGDKQKDKYQEFQFDNIKQDPVVVAEAKEISSEEDQVRQAGFYDIDQAFLETDPTAINTWHPTDSQILQAHSAGMNLNEYVQYMHELSKGETGDYTKLPTYTWEERRQSGLLDYYHFRDELAVAGYRKDLYFYDENTGKFRLNPNVTNSAIPSTQNTFISRYTPTYLLKARQEYADMIHGLNEKNQNQVDNYNNNLMKELISYGKHYDSIVANINDERLYEGRSDLLFYDVGKMYNQNKIEFSALSDKLSDVPKDNIISQDEATGRQLGQQVSIKEKYTLDSTQYKNVKLDLESKNIVDATPEQINQSVETVKSSVSN
jgi:hypothetical protein